jgi:uncharacterized repeat protein (TIGR03843 family)
MSGERPLWDFPDGTLSGREVAAYGVSELLGWQLVPPTAWRDETPAGPGMVQLWVDADHDAGAVRICSPQDAPPEWAVVLEGRDEIGQPLVLVHERSPDLARMAVFDCVINNADRKGGHILVDRAGRRWAIDHGVCFAEEDKLRTVLWGWADESIPEDVLSDLEHLEQSLDAGVDTIDRWLHPRERHALIHRVRTLLTLRTFPLPSTDWPSIPWPVM